LANTLAIFDGKDMVTEREALCASGLIYYFIDQRMNLTIDGSVKINPIVETCEVVHKFLESSKEEFPEVTKTILNNYGPKRYRKLTVDDRDKVLNEMVSRDMIVLEKEGKMVKIRLANKMSESI
jgi:hypothetical protein